MALLQIKSDYTMKGRELKKLIFDREPGVIPGQEVLNTNGIELLFKVRQKVGLAEVIWIFAWIVYLY
jgi:hypothetical protein